jgi:hypothetical protein
VRFFDHSDATSATPGNGIFFFGGTGASWREQYNDFQNLGGIHGGGSIQCSGAAWTVTGQYGNANEIFGISVPLQFAQLSSLGTCANNTARMGGLNVGSTCEMHVLDEAGNVTQFSEHSGTAPDWLYINGVPNYSEAIKPSWNIYTGVVMYRHAETGEVYRETFEEHNNRLGLSGERALSLKIWENAQAEIVAEQEARRDAWQALRDEYEELPEEDRPEWIGGEKPEALELKPRPPGLTDQRQAVIDGRAREAIEATFRTTISAGHCITPEGWCLAMDDTDRANWSQLLVLLRESEALGAINGESPVQFLDITGTPRQLPLTRFREVIVGLGQAYQTAFFTRAAALAALI